MKSPNYKSTEILHADESPVSGSATFRLPSVASMDYYKSKNESNSAPTESSSSETTSEKIERAIGQLNMDSQEIQKIKSVFQRNPATQSRFQRVESDSKLADAVGTGQRPPAGSRPMRAHPYQGKKPIPNIQVIKCKIFTNIEQGDGFMDIYAFSSELDSSCYIASLVHIPNETDKKVVPNAIAIKGFAKITKSNATGIISEKQLIGHAVIPLRGKKECRIQKVLQFPNGQVLIRVG